MCVICSSLMCKYCQATFDQEISRKCIAETSTLHDTCYFNNKRFCVFLRGMLYWTDEDLCFIYMCIFRVFMHLCNFCEFLKQCESCLVRKCSHVEIENRRFKCITLHQNNILIVGYSLIRATRMLDIICCH